VRRWLAVEGAGARPRGRDRLRLGQAVVVGAVAAAIGTLAAAGIGVERSALEEAWQLVDLDVLADDPLGSVWFLHTQPPLHNLVVGLVAWSPLPLPGTLQVLYTACLLGIGLGIHHLLVRWGVGPLAAGAATAVAVLNPYLLSSMHIGSYEVPVALAVVGTLVFAQQYLDTGRPGWLLATSGAATFGALTRSLLHPAWVVGIVAVLVAARAAPPRAVAAAALAPLVLVGGWMAKNEVLFDRFTASSWLGFNLQRGVVAPMVLDDVESAVAAGDVSPLAREQPWQTLAAYGDLAAGCEPTRDHPALAVATKERDDVPNLNAECFLPLYDQAADDAGVLLRRHPGRYLATRRDAFVLTIGATTAGPPGTSTWIDEVYDRVNLTRTLTVDATDWNLPLYGPVLMPIESSLLLGGLLVVVAGRSIVAIARLARRGARRADRARWPSEEVVWVLVGGTVAVVVVGGALAEMGENARFRTSLDPVLIALPLGTALRAVARRTAGRSGGSVAPDAVAP
jgi:hypothetical protein